MYKEALIRITPPSPDHASTEPSYPKRPRSAVQHLRHVGQRWVFQIQRFNTLCWLHGTMLMGKGWISLSNNTIPRRRHILATTNVSTRGELSLKRTLAMVKALDKQLLLHGRGIHYSFSAVRSTFHQSLLAIRWRQQRKWHRSSHF